MAWTAPKTWTTGEVVTASELNTHVRDNMLAVVPIGVVLPYAGGTAPALFLMCNGSAISRTTYAALFSLIGTSFGTGDGSTTFNLPDMRGRVSVGVNAGGPALIDALGDNDGRAQSVRNISHKHTFPSHNETSFSSFITRQAFNGGVTPPSTSTSGDGNNVDYPAFLALNFIIKVLQ